MYQFILLHSYDNYYKIVMQLTVATDEENDWNKSWH